MEVILLERIERLGQMGDVVAVKPGFARNYLLPQNKALRANKANLAFFETQRAQLEAQNLERKKDADQVSTKIEGLSVVIIRQAGDTGQLYGSVSARDIMEAVTEAGFTIERRHVVLDKAIKVLGLHPVRIRLHPEVVVEITVNVARSSNEAEQQVASGHMVTAQAQFEAEEAAIEEALELAEEADAEEANLEEEAAEDSSSDEGDEAKV